MKDLKKKCWCGCGRTLYMGLFYDDKTNKEKILVFGSEENARKSSKHFNGVLIDREDLLKWLQ